MQVNRKLKTIMATKCVCVVSASKNTKDKKKLAITKSRNCLFVAWLKQCLRYKKGLNNMGNMDIVYESHHLL